MAAGEARDRDVRAGAGARASQPAIQYVAAVFDDGEPVRVGDLTDVVPVGHVADEVGRQNCAGTRPDHLLDPVDVHLIRVRLDVDERGHDPRLHERRNVGGKREHRGDDLVSGRELEQVDRQTQRGRPRVDHHAVAFGEQVSDSVLEVVDVGADREIGAAQRADDRLDLAFVVDGARIGQPPARRPRRHARQAKRSRSCQTEALSRPPYCASP
jgi:hypothetical protein